MIDLDKAVILKAEPVTCDLMLSLVVLCDAQYYILVTGKKTNNLAMLTREPVYDLDEALELMNRYKGYWV